MSPTSYHTETTRDFEENRIHKQKQVILTSALTSTGSITYFIGQKREPGKRLSRGPNARLQYKIGQKSEHGLSRHEGGFGTQARSAAASDRSPSNALLTRMRLECRERRTKHAAGLRITKRITNPRLVTKAVRIRMKGES